MAIISIKTSQSNTAPSSLANGEIAYSYASNKLFIGQTTTSGSPVTVEYIGGKLLVDKVANLESIIVSGSGTFQTESITANNVTVTNLRMNGFPENAVLWTKANSIVDFVTGTTGKIMQIAANGSPVFDDLNGGAY
jgi:hypothetical protein